jgi:hemolysin activation/secretion protein
MRDQWQGGGVFILDGAFEFGNVDLSGSATNKALDRSTADTQGKYAKISLSASRRQSLWQGGDLTISLSGQLANKNLNSAEQFSLGGMSGTRGYAVNAGSGDQSAWIPASPIWPGQWASRSPCCWPTPLIGGGRLAPPAPPGTPITAFIGNPTSATGAALLRTCARNIL